MTCRIVTAAALLAVSLVTAGSRPAGAQAGSCTITLPASCSDPTVTGLIGTTAGRFVFGPTRTFCTFAEAINEAIRFERDLADVRSGGQLVFQDEFTRLCLEQDLLNLLDAPRTTQAQRDAVLQDITILRDNLTRLRRDGRINNCYFQLTCGFTAEGFLLRCPEPPRNCFSFYLSEVLRCAAALVNDNTPC